MDIKAKVIAASRFPDDTVLYTFEVEFHRFILAEVNTHKRLSRNYQSSRAVTIPAMIAQITNNPAMPVHWGINQRGMVAEEQLSAQDEAMAVSIWRCAAQAAAGFAAQLDELKVHKQVVNRLMEPFMTTKGVISATGYALDKMFELRLHKDVQPEFQALAGAMKDAVDGTVSDILLPGDYHLPYIQKFMGDDGIYYVNSSNEVLTLEDAIKTSASCIAQVSYRVLDDGLEKSNSVFSKLNLPWGNSPTDPPHYSPTEHIAKCANWGDIMKNYSANYDSRFIVQLRRALEGQELDWFLNDGK